jgi:Ca2+-binding EF-hand superfamily protein
MRGKSIFQPKPLLAARAAALMAGAALAQPPDARPASPSASSPAQKPVPPPRIFISPSGEPFRWGPTMSDPLKAWFDRVDANQDGVIDRFEFRADAARFFKVLDENGDGVIDGFEVSDYEHKIAPELAEQAEGRLPGQFAPRDQGAQHEDRPKPGQRTTEPHRDAHEAGPGGPGRARGIAQLIDEPEPVTGADFNLDSHITMAEWMRATDQRFDLLDTAKTGRLTLDGLRAKMAELQKRQQQQQRQPSDRRAQPDR